jgi:protein TonB
MIRRFTLLSVALHLSVALAFFRSVPLHLAAPSAELQATLMAPQASISGRRQPANHTDQSSADAPPLLTATRSATQVGAKNTDSGADRSNGQSDATGNQAIINHLLSELRMAVDAGFVYPPIARRHGWQGKVQLGLTVAADGRLSDLSVLSSSGYAVLDADAVRTVARIGSLPRAAAALAGRSVRLQLPVYYRLIES